MAAWRTHCLPFAQNWNLFPILGYTRDPFKKVYSSGKYSTVGWVSNETKNIKRHIIKTCKLYIYISYFSACALFLKLLCTVK